ncbi:MAG: hypothetical protein WC375_10240 [Methanomassiliicoccales archaeon]|jgi:hypothetical protein
MRECLEIHKHGTCQSRAWNGDRSKKLCNYCGSFQSCFYKSDFVHFKDIKGDTIMYSGNIESTGDFKTKAEWVEHDDFRAKCEEIWHTASIKTAEIDLPSLLGDIAESEEMYEGWYSDVLPVCEDPVVEAGIKRINEIFSGYPTYMEDLRVTFD